jgi:hypothetical protein
MMCDQATCTLYTAMSRQEVQTQFRISELQRALSDAPPTISREMAFSAVPRDAIACFATLHHEMDHLRRQFSNPCGLLALHLRSRLIEACQHLILEERNRGSEFPFPLLLKFERADWLSHAISDPVRLVERWMAQNDQSRTVLTALATSAGIRGLEQGARVRDRVLTDAAMLRASGDGRFAPIGFAHPYLQPEIDESIGSIHIYEHMALLHELCWRSRLGGEMQDWGELIEGDQRYRRILMLWHSFFPDAMHLDQGAMRLKDLITDVYRMYPVEFYALLDLALWIPFTPHGFRTTKRALRWEDIQPGHRFHRSIALLRDSGHPLTPITSEDREKRFDATQEWVADELDWERARNLANEWAEYLATEQWREDGLFIGFEPNPVISIARKMLEHRRRSPFDTVCNNIAWQQDSEMRFATWITNEGSAGFGIGGLTDDPTFSATRDAYFLFHGCECLLFGESADRCLMRLDEASRREAVTVIDNALSCEGWDSAYFQSMTEPGWASR